MSEWLDGEAGEIGALVLMAIGIGLYLDLILTAVY